jgi:prefoldin subunit 5
MEFNNAIDIILGIAAFSIGWTMKRLFHNIDNLWKKHDEMTDKVAQMAVEMPKQYVTKGDLTRAIDVIHSRFDKLEEKLEKHFRP